MSLPITGWKKFLGAFGYRVNWKGVEKLRMRRHLTRKRQKSVEFQFEKLEPRKLLASGIELVNGQLQIDMENLQSNEVVLTSMSQAGESFVAVNGAPTEYYASAVSSIQVDGSAGDDRINLQGVNAFSFPSLTSGAISVDGGAGNDEILGSSLGSTLGGGAGDDTIYGGLGVDVISGGYGADTIFAGGGDDVVLGGAGNDELFGGSGDDDLDGQADDDTIHGDQGADLVLGGTGDDVLTGGEGSDQVEGGDGDDSLSGGLDDDVLVGGAGNDAMEGGEGSDSLDGSGGDDRYVFSGNGELGVDVIAELDGAGTDSLDFSGMTFEGGVNVNLSIIDVAQQVAGTGAATASIQIGTTGQADAFVENVVGSSQADILHGSNLDNRLEGLAGDDTLDGGYGTDELLGGGGNDVLHVGRNLPSEEDASLLDGGAGDDRYVIRDNSGESLAHQVIVKDASGSDTFDFSTLVVGGVVVNLSSAQPVEGVADVEVSFAEGVASVENVIGSDFDDVLIGSPVDNRLQGGGGRDSFESGGGDDVFLGEAGVDDLEVVDQADSGSTQSSAWAAAGHSGGFNQGQQSVEPSTVVGLQTADWVFDNLEPGQYEVYVTWAAHPDDINNHQTNGATNAQVNVSVDGSSVFSEQLNQRQAPEGAVHGGVAWERLLTSVPFNGMVTVASGTVHVELSNQDANGLVYADAVRLVKVNQAPVLTSVGTQTAAVGVDLNVPLTASDIDNQAADLTFELAGNSPDGLAIVSDGPGMAHLEWPAAGRPEGEFWVTVIVHDNGYPNSTTSETFAIQLGNVNTTGPSIQSLSNVTGGTLGATGYDVTVDEQIELSFDVLATGTGTLHYSLGPAAPADATIDGNGHFSWTPSESQSSEYNQKFEIRVTDMGHPNLRVSQVIQIKVDEVNTVAFLDGPISVKNLSGVDPVIVGNVVNDGDLDNVQVVIELTSVLGTATTLVPVTASEFDPNVGTFAYEPDIAQFIDANGGYSSLQVRARTQEIDPITESVLDGVFSNSISLSLDPNTNVLPTMTLELKEDVGPVGSPATTQPVIHGFVDHLDGPIDNLMVTVYNGWMLGDVGLVGTVRTNENGEFSFTARDFTASQTINLWFVVSEETAIGTLDSLPTQFSFDYLDNAAPVITTLSLVNDSGASSTDGVTNDLTIEGQISHADGFIEGVTIEIDEDSDGVVDGAAQTDELGNFVYQPTKIVAGSTYFLNARAVEWDEYNHEVVEGNWLTGAARLSITYDLAENLAPSVDTLDVLYPTSGGVVVDPVVWGMVSNDQGLRNIAVEFSAVDPSDPAFDRTKDVIGASLPDENGRFEFRVGGLKAGEPYTIFARAIEQIPGPATAASHILFDNANVQSTTFTISSTPIPTTQFSGIELVYDTGVISVDGQTADPTLKGAVVYAGDYSQLTVEFSLDQSDETIGTATPDQDGNFTFKPEGLVDGQDVTIRARVRVPDYAHRPIEFDDATFDESDYASAYDETNGWDHTQLDQWLDDVFNADHTAFEGDWYNSGFQRDWNGHFEDLLTDWQSTTFTLDMSQDLAPVVSGVQLNDPASPMNPTITGSVSNDGMVAGLEVQIFVNGNPVADGTTTTDEAGQFVYTMQEHTVGINDVVVRVVEPVYDADQGTETDSSPFSIDIAENPDVKIINFETKSKELVNGQWQSIDPTLIGSVETDGEVAGLIVRFDYDNDGVVDGETWTDSEGNFEFTPVGLTVDGVTNQTTVRAQVVFEDEGTSEGETYRTFSSWESFSWEVLPNDAPQITRFELKNDTGHVGLGHEVLDRVTSNPTLVGHVANQNGSQYLTVEFDHDGDGVVDGAAFTDEDGNFEYVPQGLNVGGHDIRARVREMDYVNDTELSFDYEPGTVPIIDSWARITGTGNPTITTSNPAPAFYGFTLVEAVAANVTSLTHSGNNLDPTLSGTITDSEGSDSTVIAFHLNNADGSTDFLGTTNAKSDGSFAFTPVGLSFGSLLSVTATASKHDYFSGEALVGTTVSPVTFNFSQTSSFDLSVTNFEEKASNDPFDPTVTGHVEATSTITPVFVEIEIDGEVVDSIPVDWTDHDPNNTQGFFFDFRPELTSSADPVTIRVRPVGEVDDGYRFGGWSQLTLTYDLNLASIGDRVDPATGGNGWDIEDDNSSTPTITGEFEAIPVSTGATVNQPPLVEFDLDGDGVVDASVTAEDTDTVNLYSFRHTFRDLPPGNAEVMVRVTRYETVNLEVPDGTTGLTSARQETIVGDWQTINFDLINPAPTIDPASFALVNEIGNDPIPTATDPTFTGQVGSLGTDNLIGMTIEIDHDGDGTVDGTTVTTADGSFQYSPVNLSRDVEYGVVTLRVRAIDSYTQQEPIVGEWVDFTFNFQAIDSPVVTSLELGLNESPSGTPESSNATVEGTVEGHESAGLITIEFDHDGDGEVDGEVTADYLGQFTYQAQGLSYGTHTIRARAVTQIGDEVLTGEFADPTDPDFANSSIEFLYIGAMPPTVSDAVIANTDTGEVSGRLTVDGYGADGYVEIVVASGGTDVVNGIVATDAQGYFAYQPTEMTAGTVVIKVRGILGDPDSPDAIIGDSQPLGNFNFAPAALPSTLPDAATFGLAHDTGVSSTDSITSDGTLVGTIDTLLPETWVDISYDGFQTIVASVAIASDGSFAFRPNSQDLANPVTVEARTRVWDPYAGKYLVNTNTSLASFTFDETANQDAVVSTLNLRDNVSPTGQTEASSSPIFIGQVTNDGPVNGLKVLFDHDGDGIPEGFTTTKSDGSFVYRAIGLTAGAATQTITATVVERDYDGDSINGAPIASLDFILNSAPIISSLDYVPLAGLEGQVTGTVSTPGSLNRHIEYQVFGNNGGNQTVPTSPSGYVPGDLLETGTVDAMDGFNIDLEPFGLGVGNAAVLVRVVDNDSSRIGPWEILNFSVAPTSSAPQAISQFELVEDTGNSDTDGLTSNPTYSGMVGANGSGAFATIEFTVTEVGGSSDPQVYRTTANGNGFFSWTAPQLTVGSNYDVDAQHVVYDPATQQETLGTATSSTFTFLNNNQQATILNFGLLDATAPITDPTFTGSVQDDGRVAGLRIEYDTNGDEDPDGFAFTDGNGDFQFTLYNVQAGQPTTVRVRVVEWDGVAQEYTSPDFANVNGNQSVTFTLDQDGPTGPEMGDEFDGTDEAVEAADGAALDAVFSHMASQGLGDGAAGTFDVGVGSIRLGVQDYSASLDDSAPAENPIFMASGTKPTTNESINLQNVTIGSLATLADGLIDADGSTPSTYTLTKTVTVNGNMVSTDIYYRVVVAKYTSGDSYFGGSSSMEMTSEYTFEFSSELTYVGDEISSGNYTLVQHLNRTYLRTGSTSTDTGSSSYTSAGSLDWYYEEENAVFTGGDLLTSFTSTGVRHDSHWSTAETNESSHGGPGTSLNGAPPLSNDTYSWSTQGTATVNATSTTTFNSTGTITQVDGVQTVDGDLSVVATGSANASYEVESSFSSNFGDSSSSGTMAVVGSVQSEAELYVDSDFETDVSIATVWSLEGSSQSTVYVSGSGQSSENSTNNTSSASWNFSVNAAVEGGVEASGNIAVDLSGDEDVVTFSSTASLEGLVSVSGNASGSSTYSRSNGAGRSDSGEASFSTSFGTTAESTGNVSAHGTDDVENISGNATAEFDSNFSSNSHVSGTSITPKEEVHYSSMSSESGTTSGSSHAEGSETPDLIESSGYTAISSNGTFLTASQSYGTRETPDGVVPFRNNSAAYGEYSVSGRVVGSYERNPNDPSDQSGLLSYHDDDGTYQSAANFDMASTVTTKASSYVGIVGKYPGFHLEKSTGVANDMATMSGFDDNGTVTGNGSMRSAFDGTTDSITHMSGVDNSQTGVIVTVSLDENVGTEVSSVFVGSFELEASGTSTSRGKTHTDLAVKADSNRTYSVLRFDDEGTSMMSTSNSTKLFTNMDSSASAKAVDDEVVSQAASYNSDHVIRAVSTVDLFATRTKTEGDTYSSGTFTFGTRSDYLMVGAMGVKAAAVGESTRSKGFMNSELTGSTTYNGSIAGTSHTETTDSTTTASINASFNGISTVDSNMGGYFFGKNGSDTVVVSASGSDSSTDESSSTMSSSYSGPSSSSSITVSTDSTSGENTSFSANSMEIGGVVGTESGTVSMSESSQSVTKIKSQGNSKSGDSSAWNSRTATITATESFSASGTFYGVEGSEGPSGQSTGSESGSSSQQSNQSDDLSSVVWAFSDSTSLKGTIRQGSFHQFSSNVDGIGVSGFTKFKSIANLSSTTGMAASSSSPELSVTQTTGLSANSKLETVLSGVEENGSSSSGPNDPMNPGSPGAPGAPEPGSITIHVFRETTNTSQLHRLNESITGDEIDRTVVESQNGNRITLSEEISEEHHEIFASDVGWKYSIDYVGGGGYESLVMNQSTTEHTVNSFEDFIEEAVTYTNGHMDMNDWVSTHTLVRENRFSANTDRFSQRERSAESTRFEGTVDYSYYDYFGANSYDKRATNAYRLNTSSSSHEIVSSGWYGLPATHVDMADRSEYDKHFNATTTRDANLITHQPDGDYVAVIKTRDYDNLNSDGMSRSAFKSRYGKPSEPDQYTHDGEFNFSTDFSTGTTTDPNGNSTTNTSFGADTKIYSNTQKDDGPDVGFLTTFGYKYSSVPFMQMVDTDGDGIPDTMQGPLHWHHYFFTDSWPEGGVTPGNGESVEGDDGSYDPSNYKRSNNEDSESGTEIVPAKPSKSLYNDWVRRGMITRYEGWGTDYFIVHANGKKFVFQENTFYGTGTFLGAVYDSTSDADLFEHAFNNTIHTARDVGFAVGRGVGTSGKALTNTVVSTATLGIVDEAIAVTENDLGYSGARFGFEAALAVAPGAIIGKVKDAGKVIKTSGRIINGLDTGQAVVTTGRGVYGGLSDGWDSEDILQTAVGITGLPLTKGSRQVIDDLAPNTAARAKSGWLNFRGDLGGATLATGYGAKYGGKLSWANRLGLRQGYSTTVRNFDAGGSWFARMDTAVHEGFHALVGKHLPSVWKAGDATLFKVPVGAPIKYVEEVFAYAAGHGGAFRFHGIPFAPIEAFGSLSRGETITTIIFGIGGYGIYEYFND